MYPRSMADSDWSSIMGSNMAESHPVAFRWLMQAKGARRQADPRRSALHPHQRDGRHLRADPGRLDIAFLGGLIAAWWKRTLEQTRSSTSVVNYTNAATIIGDEFQDAEDLDGVFSGLMEYAGGDPNGLNGFIGKYETRAGSTPALRSATRAGRRPPRSPARAGRASRAADRARARRHRPVRRSTRWSVAAETAAERDQTLQHPRCVFQIVRRHFARYTPEMVEQVDRLSPGRPSCKVAEALLGNSGPDRTGAIGYAVGWTQHTNGVQMIGAAAMLQLLLGNIGRPGGGIMALRGHASIQGSTDIPTLYHSIPGYMPTPSALKRHDTLRDYIEAETLPTELLGEHAEVHRQPSSSRCSATPPRPTTTSATTGTPGSSATTRTCRCSWP